MGISITKRCMLITFVCFLCIGAMVIHRTRLFYVDEYNNRINQIRTSQVSDTLDARETYNNAVNRVEQEEKPKEAPRLNFNSYENTRSEKVKSRSEIRNENVKSPSLSNRNPEPVLHRESDVRHNMVEQPQRPVTKVTRSVYIQRQTTKPHLELAHKVDSSVQNKFESIARSHSWGGGDETVSGTGSTVAATVSVRGCIGRWIEMYDIKSIVDIPCGDANWQRYIPGIDRVSYKGYDISSFAVERARRANSNNKMEFGVLDLTSVVPPKADLITIRDAIQHLPLELGQRALENARRSGAKWLGVSSYPSATYNRNIQTGDYYLNNVERPPFSLTNITDRCDNYSGRESAAHPGSKFLLIKLR